MILIILQKPHIFSRFPTSDALRNGQTLFDLLQVGFLCNFKSYGTVFRRNFSDCIHFDNKGSPTGPTMWKRYEKCWAPNNRFIWSEITFKANEEFSLWLKMVFECAGKSISYVFLCSE